MELVKSLSELFQDGLVQMGMDEDGLPVIRKFFFPIFQNFIEWFRHLQLFFTPYNM